MRKKCIYESYIKRLLDVVLSGICIIILSPMILLFTILGIAIMRGNPFFVQERPGKYGKIFKMIKFRTMTNAKDGNGKLLPDEKRLTKYGAFLRKTSLDEIPELFNIFVGTMSIVGPRPQLVKDLLFMNDEQRKRHDAMPGLTGLAQVQGRNNISWNQKLEYDLEYIKNVSFKNDLKIVFKTVAVVLNQSDVDREGTSSDLDFGDWLLKEGYISRERYNSILNMEQ